MVGVRWSDAITDEEIRWHTYQLLADVFRERKWQWIGRILLKGDNSMANWSGNRIPLSRDDPRVDRPRSRNKERVPVSWGKLKHSAGNRQRRYVDTVEVLCPRGCLLESYIIHLA